MAPLRFLENWASPLIGIGICQLLFSFGIIVPSALTVASCKGYYFVSWALIPGVLLFVMGCVTVSGFKCNPRMLLALGLINFFLIAAGIASMAAGGIGIKCELKGREPKGQETHHNTSEGHCCAFGNLIDEDKCCKDKSKPVKKDSAIAVHASILVFAILDTILCIAAAAVSIKARSQLSEEVDLGSGIGVLPGDAGPVMVSTQPGQAAAPGGINISNVNTLGVTTTVTDGQTTTTTTAGDPNALPGPQPQTPLPQPQSSASGGFTGSGSARSKSKSKSRSKSRSKSGSTKSSQRSLSM